MALAEGIMRKNASMVRGGSLGEAKQSFLTHLLGWTCGDDDLRVGKFKVYRRGGRGVDEDSNTTCCC